MKILSSLILISTIILTTNYNLLFKIPEAEITNGIIKVKIYLPDAENGYYRGSRFDWSGVIPDLEYKGHSYYGKWFHKYSPTNHDAIMGPVNDFAPLGYETAKVGESFVKIGIGVLVKPEEPRYSIVTPYKIINHGDWKINKKSYQIEFIQKIEDKDYSYEYKKLVNLPKGKSQLVLEHSLKNTGNKTIKTSVYNHNFLMIDEQPVDSNYVIKFPFELSGKMKGADTIAFIDNNQIKYKRQLLKKENAYFTDLYGFGDTARDYEIIVENRASKAGVNISGNRALSRLVFWSASTTVCPEPYININVEPGRTFKWKIVYNYYIID